jgi:hypothetical protein
MEPPESDHCEWLGNSLAGDFPPGNSKSEEFSTQSFQGTEKHAGLHVQHPSFCLIWTKTGMYKKIVEDTIPNFMKIHLAIPKLLHVFR